MYSNAYHVSDQHKIQDQVALLLETIFELSPPSGSKPFNWGSVIDLLFKARRDSSSPLSRQIAHVIINRKLPKWLRKHNSASLLYCIGEATCDFAENSWEDGIALFTHLDKIMKDMCARPGRVKELYEDSVEDWRELRTLSFQGLVICLEGLPSIFNFLTDTSTTYMVVYDLFLPSTSLFMIVLAQNLFGTTNIYCPVLENVTHVYAFEEFTVTVLLINHYHYSTMMLVHYCVATHHSNLFYSLLIDRTKGAKNPSR